MPQTLNLETLNHAPHRRLNPLTGDWVLVSPQRAERPWQGQTEKPANPQLSSYDPNCYLCPRNERAAGARNPDYKSTFVFTNDFAALKPETRPSEVDDDGKGLLVAKSERGTCRVVCFSPSHNLTLSRMTTDAIRSVVDVWTEEHQQLGSSPDINYVQIFENRGEMMGCSNPHPHGQIWANQTIPNKPCKEQASQLEYLQKHHACLLCNYLQLEMQAQDRIVCENSHFLALVPFWAVWPFEVMLLSKAHAADILSLESESRNALADILKRLTTRYDTLFSVSFPYSMGFHQAPTDQKPHPEWHLHAHFYPPLLRSASVRKFMVGYEMLAGAQRDITPESAAARLREVSEKHFTK
jgi:UDPglucose--hexose-1-phosphate uridylyltransferase